MTIAEIIQKYKDKLDYLDAEILIAHSLGKTREFVLTYPEKKLTGSQSSAIDKLMQRRIKGEPVAYIINHKEFYGLDFIVNKHTLVPRPETEQMVESVLSESPATVIDIGTGSGCIIISIAHESKDDIPYYATDISKDALTIAKKNARLNGVDKKIKFLHGSLLEPFLKNKLLLANELFITANLPYLSKEIYDAAPIDVKKFEPRSALYSPELGLQHYRKLLEQVQELQTTNRELRVTLFLEISPEQKKLLPKLIKDILPASKIEFKKDLADKWRICEIVS